MGGGRTDGKKQVEMKLIHILCMFIPIGTRPRAGAVSLDSDADAEAAAILGASASHYDSLKRHVTLTVDG